MNEKFYRRYIANAASDSKVSYVAIEQSYDEIRLSSLATELRKNSYLNRLLNILIHKAEAEVFHSLKNKCQLYQSLRYKPVVLTEAESMVI